MLTTFFSYFNLGKASTWIIPLWKRCTLINLCVLININIIYLSRPCTVSVLHIFLPMCSCWPWKCPFVIWCYLCLLPALCSLWFWLLKTLVLYEFQRLLAYSQKQFNCVFPSICFPCFVQCFCFPLFSHGSLRPLIPPGIPPPPAGG